MAVIEEPAFSCSRQGGQLGVASRGGAGASLQPGRGQGRRLLAHVEHLGNGRDAGDGLLAEFSDSVGKRPEQFAIHVDGTAAHAGDDSGVLWFSALQTGENHVLMRAQSIL